MTNSNMSNSLSPELRPVELLNNICTKVTKFYVQKRKDMERIKPQWAKTRGSGHRCVLHPFPNMGKRLTPSSNGWRWDKANTVSMPQWHNNHRRKTVLKALACKDNCVVQYTLYINISRVWRDLWKTQKNWRLRNPIRSWICS